MTSRFLVQDFRSRAESLRRILSNDTWYKGVGSFFSENVPFSYSTSRYFAEKIISLLSSLDATQESVNITELGAGLGLLSKRLLTTARDINIDLLSKLNITVTDQSEACIDGMRAHGIFQHFQEHVRIEQENAIEPDSVSSETDLVIMSYLLDSLDCHHIEVIDGAIYEVVVQTEFEQSQPILDSTLWLPNLLNDDDIKRLLFASPTREKLIVLSQLTSNLRESFKRIPLDESTMLHKEKEELKDFVSWLNCDHDLIFNYSPMASQCLESTLSQLGERGLCFIYDFGYSEKVFKKSYEKLYSSYGSCSFFDVYFPFIQYKAESIGFSFRVTSFDHGKSQYCLLSKGHDEPQLTELFQQLFVHCQSALEVDVIADIEKVEQQDKFLAHVENASVSIPQSLRQGYYFLHRLAQEHFKRKLYDQAEHYCREIIQFYGPMGVSAYHLLGLISLEKGDYQEAISIFKTCIDAAPFISELYLHLSLAYGHVKEYERFQSTCRQYFFFSSGNVAWNHYITYALVLIMQGKRQEAHELVTWLRQTLTVYKESVPDYLFVKIDTMVTQYSLS